MRLDEHGKFNLCAQIDHPYPTTNIMWKPSKSTSGKDLFATTGDYLRVWSVSEEGNAVRLEALHNVVRDSLRLMVCHVPGLSPSVADRDRGCVCGWVKPEQVKRLLCPFDVV